jgi:hypothetical protein
VPRRSPRLNLKNGLNTVVGICVISLALIPLLLAPDTIQSSRWKLLIVALAVVAVAALFAQSIIQTSEENKQREERAERDQRMTTAIEEIAKAMPVEPKEERFLVENVWPKNDGKKAVLVASFVRSYLMPRSPFQSIVDEVFKMAGNGDYRVTCDFVCEVHVVNETDNAVTIRAYDCMAILETTCVGGELIEDLSTYQLRFGEGPNAPRRDLEGLAVMLRGVPLTRGVGYQGWLRFGITLDHKTIEKKVPTQLAIIDAFGNRHEVLLRLPLQPEDGELVHNPAHVFD